MYLYVNLTNQIMYVHAFMRSCVPICINVFSILNVSVWRTVCTCVHSVLHLFRFTFPFDLLTQATWQQTVGVGGRPWCVFFSGPFRRMKLKQWHGHPFQHRVVFQGARRRHGGHSGITEGYVYTQDVSCSDTSCQWRSPVVMVWWTYQMRLRFNQDHKYRCHVWKWRERLLLLKMKRHQLRNGNVQWFWSMGFCCGTGT